MVRKDSYFKQYTGWWSADFVPRAWIILSLHYFWADHVDSITIGSISCHVMSLIIAWTRIKLFSRWSYRLYYESYLNLISTITNNWSVTYQANKSRTRETVPYIVQGWIQRGGGCYGGAEESGPHPLENHNWYGAPFERGRSVRPSVKYVFLFVVERIILVIRWTSKFVERQKLRSKTRLTSSTNH